MIARRSLLAGAASVAATTAARAQKPTSVRWWYHFDDPKAVPDELVATFEAQNPGIKIQAESIPWGGGADYDTRLYTALIAGNGPDAAMVKFQNMPRLMEMDALLPLDKYIGAWPGRADISDDLWKLHRGPDGKVITCRCNTSSCTCMCGRTGWLRKSCRCRILSTNS